MTEKRVFAEPIYGKRKRPEFWPPVLVMLTVRSVVSDARVVDVLKFCQHGGRYRQDLFERILDFWRGMPAADDFYLTPLMFRYYASG